MGCVRIDWILDWGTVLKHLRNLNKDCVLDNLIELILVSLGVNVVYENMALLLGNTCWNMEEWTVMIAAGFKWYSKRYNYI